jgi:peptidoglycan/xylan/chitin deacetylase (PgdA/CDA1 family)
VATGLDAVSDLKIVMYHYVRTASRTAFPRLPALSEEAFETQLDMLQRDHQVIGWDTLLTALDGGEALPERAAFLTFDDGLSDHMETVLPQLRKRGMTAAFFPTVRAAADRRMLDVHRLQFIIAAATDHPRLADRLDAAIEGWRVDHAIDPPAVLRERYKSASRFDGPAVSYFKKTLQKEIPAPLRDAFLVELFREVVGVDEASFARGLYLDAAALRELRDAGMTIGHHGCEHLWLDRLCDEDLEAEIDAGYRFLTENRLIDAKWSIAYPFGGVDSRVVAAARDKGAAVGFTVEPRVADIGREDPLLLPRLDTTDLRHG